MPTTTQPSQYNREDVLRAITNAAAAGDSNSVQRLAALLSQSTDSAPQGPADASSSGGSADPVTPTVNVPSVVVRGAIPITQDPLDSQPVSGFAAGTTRGMLARAVENARAAGDENSAERLAGALAEHDVSQQDDQAVIRDQLRRDPDWIGAAKILWHSDYGSDSSAAPQEGQPVTEDQLRHDPEWIQSAKVLWQMNHGDDGADALTADQGYANYALDEMGCFNSNLPQMAAKAVSLLNASDEQRRAFMYLMDRSENLAWSWEGIGRMARGAVTDPFNYVGVGSLGLGEAGVQAAKFATREGIRELVHAGINTGVKAAAEGAISGASRNYVQQNVDVLGGGQTGIDYGEVGRNAAAGAGAGFAAGGVLGATAKGLRQP